jgi:hypothetical protein
VVVPTDDRVDADGRVLRDRPIELDAEVREEDHDLGARLPELRGLGGREADERVRDRRGAEELRVAVRDEVEGGDEGEDADLHAADLLDDARLDERGEVRVRWSRREVRAEERERGIAAERLLPRPG